MSLSDFDQAARYLIKLDPVTTLGWILPKLGSGLQFQRWLETQSISYPGESERRCDTVMELVSETGTVPPWAIVVDSQTRPDSSMMGRLLEYLALLYRILRHGPHGKDAYQVGAMLLNLTGPTQNSELEMALSGEPEVGLHFKVKTLTLEKTSAENHLQIVEEKKAWALLPWTALMENGSEPETIQKWEELAKQEPDHRRRSDIGFLTRIFARLRPGAELWEELLKEWNVEQSTLLREWMDKGREEGRVEGQVKGEAKGKRESLLDVIQRWGDPVPEDLRKLIEQENDLDQLSQWFRQALAATSVDEIRQIIAK